MVFHVPTGVSLAAQAAPAAMATSTVAAYSSGRIAVFMGSLQNGLIIIDGTASRACAESVLNHHRARFAGLTACIARADFLLVPRAGIPRSEAHTSELQSLMRLSYAVLCLKKKKHNKLK